MRRLALYLIRLLTPLTYEPKIAGDIREKIQPVVMPDGKPLVLKYLGKDRQIYKYKNENDSVIGRTIWLHFFEQEKDLNVTIDLINKYISESLKSHNASRHHEVANNLVMLKDTINNCTPIDVLYNQAAVLFFDLEEDVNVYDADRVRARVKAMKLMPDQGFFLLSLLKLSGFSGGESLSDIEISLRKDLVKLKAYERILSDNNASTTSTAS